MADISKITLADGTSYDIKDAKARELITALDGKPSFLGITTTELTDGSTETSISINDESVSAVAGNIVLYGSKEFIFNGTAWQEFGDLSTLGALAAKDNVQADYTPAGTISQPTTTIDATTTTLGTLSDVGTLPTYTVEGETLVFGAGTLPTKTEVDVVTKINDATTTAPTFTGTTVTITAS